MRARAIERSENQPRRLFSHISEILSTLLSHNAGSTATMPMALLFFPEEQPYFK